MTTDAFGIPGELTDAEARDRAQQDYRNDPTISGAELGRRYDRTARWGVKQTHAVRNADGTVVPIRSEPTKRAVPEPKSPRMQAPARHPSGRPQHVPTAVYWTAVIGTGMVAAITAVASYEHMRVLADANGQGWMSYILPVSVDGLMLVATMVVLVLRGRGQRAGLAWTSLVLGVCLSVVANVASAYQLPAWTAGAVSAWPPLFLLIAIELLLQLRSTPRRKRS